MSDAPLLQARDLRKTRGTDHLDPWLDPLLEVLPLLAEGCGVQEARADGERGEDDQGDGDERRGLVRSVVGVAVMVIV